MTASDRLGLISCHLAAPRAVSSAVSSSRWLASSLLARISAAPDSSSSCRPLMTTSALAALRPAAALSSVCGSDVETTRLPALGSDAAIAVTLLARPVSSAGWIEAVCASAR